jgi:hypothetical protein
LAAGLTQAAAPSWNANNQKRAGSAQRIAEGGIVGAGENHIAPSAAAENFLGAGGGCRGKDKLSRQPRGEKSGDRLARARPHDLSGSADQEKYGKQGRWDKIQKITIIF